MTKKSRNEKSVWNDKTAINICIAQQKWPFFPKTIQQRFDIKSIDWTLINKASDDCYFYSMEQMSFRALFIHRILFIVDVEHLKRAEKVLIKSRISI